MTTPDNYSLPVEQIIAEGEAVLGKPFAEFTAEDCRRLADEYRRMARSDPLSPYYQSPS